MSGRRRIRALISEPNGTARIEQIAIELDVLQKLVGGYIEVVSQPTFMIYIDEEGKLANKPVNRPSTLLLDWLIPGFARQDVLVGSVVWLGFDTGDLAGDGERDVPGNVVAGYLGTALAEATPDHPISVVRWRDQVHVFDDLSADAVFDRITALVGLAERRADEGNGFGTIEIATALSRDRWAELLAGLRDDITVHDMRADQS